MALPDFIEDMRPHWPWLASMVAVLGVSIKCVRRAVVVSFDWLTKPRGAKAATIAIAAGMQELAGAVKSVQGTLTGILRKLEEHEKLAKIADARSRIDAQGSKDARWEADEHGRCVWVNEALCDMFGMSAGAMLGRGWTDAITPGHAHRVIADFRRAYESSDYNYRSPYAIIRHGKLVNIVTHAVETLRDEHGKVIRMFGACETVQPTINEEPKSA